MLRNTGINVTERKIRQDTQKAYEYDFFHGSPRRSWRRDDGYLERDIRDAGFKANIRRLPRYNYTIPRHIPTYARSSISSCIRHSELERVKMIYLPEKDWSAESPYVIPEPRYREDSYSNHKSYHIGEVERPFRRNLRYNAACSPRRTSSICLDDNQMERIIDATKYIIDNYCPRRDSSKYRSPARKVTRKLSPIRTRDCNTSSNVQQPKKNCTTNFDNPIRTHIKPKSNHVSREPRKMSLDIHKILSLLQKADVEEEEQYSSESLLQKVHNLECSSTNNANHRKTDLITERVQIFPNMEKKVQDPLAMFKNVSGVRSKLEALVNLLKQYEDESTLNSCPAVGSSKKDIVPKFENPPSQEVRSFLNEKDVKSSNDEAKEHIGQKDIVLQTEEPKTSNKSICGYIKKNNSIEDRKLLKKRFSWKSKERTELKKYKEREKGTVKESDRKKMSYFKKISKDKTLSEKTMASKQHLTNNSHEAKTGLMITIGGKVLRKKLAKSEKRPEKMSKTWLKKYLASKKDTKDHNIHHRWNNRAYYTKSSSTVMELINNVYNQMGVNLKSKTDDVSRNPYILKSSRRNGHKSPRKTRNRQRVEAYMMPQMVTHGPVYMPDKILNANTNHVTKSIEKLVSNTKLPFEQNIHLQNEYSVNSKILTMTNDPSSIFFRIYMAKDYFDTVSISNQEPRNSTSDERVYKIVEYEATRSDIISNSFTENLSQEVRSIVHNENDGMHRDAIVQVSYANSGFLKKCGVETTIVSEQGPENETNKPEYQMQELVDEEASSKTSSALAEQAIQDCLPVCVDVPLPAQERLSKSKSGHQGVEENKAANTYNQDAGIQSSKLSSPTHDQEMLCSKKSEDIALRLIVPGKNTNTATKNRVLSKNSTEVSKRRKFYTSRKSKRLTRIKPIVIIRWSDHIETFRKIPGKQFKIDKCTYYCSESEKKSKSKDQSLLQFKSTQYSYQIQYPYVHQIPYQQTLPIPQHLQLPQYLPQALYAPQLSYPQYIKISRQPYEPELLSHSKYALGPQFIPEVQYAPKTAFEPQDVPKPQHPLKNGTSFEPQYAHQTLYPPIAEPTVEPKYTTQVKYLPRVELKPEVQLSTGASFLLGSQLEVRTSQVHYSPGVQCVPEAQVREIYRPLIQYPAQYPAKAKLHPERLKANEKLETKNPYMKPSTLLLSAKVDSLKEKVEFETKFYPKETAAVLPTVKLKKINGSEPSQSKILFESKQLTGLTQAQTIYPSVIFKDDQPDEKLRLEKSQNVIRFSPADSSGFQLQPSHYSSGHQVPCLQSTGPQHQLQPQYVLTSGSQYTITPTQSHTQYSRPLEHQEPSLSQRRVCVIGTSKQKLTDEQSPGHETLPQPSQDPQETNLRSTKSNNVNEEEQGITEIYRRCKDGIGLHLKIFPFNNVTFIETRSKKKRVTKELNHHKHYHQCKCGGAKKMRNKNIACLTQTSKLGRNSLSSNISSDSDTSEVQLKLQVTGGGQVINIYIDGACDPHKMHNLKSTNQQSSQEKTGNNKAVEQMVQPTIRILNDCIKIHFGLVKPREFKISNNLMDHVISDGFSEHMLDKFKTAAKRLSGSVLSASKQSKHNFATSFHQILGKCYSRATSPQNEEAHDNSLEPCIIKRTNRELKNKDSQVDKNSSLENFNVVEGYVNHLLDPVVEIKHNNLKWVAETKSMLEAIKTMNGSGCADMTLTNIKMNNDLNYLTIKPKKSKYREIVDKLNNIIQNNKIIKPLKEQIHITDKENPVIKSKMSRFSSICNSLARKLNMSTVLKRQHEKLDVNTSCNTKTDRDDVTRSGSNLEIQDIQRRSPMTSTVPAASLENNKNAVDDSKTEVGKDDTNDICPPCQIYKCRSSKRDKLFTKVKQTFSHCMKNMKKNSIKKNEKNIATTNKINDTVMLANVTPYKCREKSYLIEHKNTYEIPVMINKNSVKMNNNPIDVIFNESEQADILQSCIVKKAVLQIYTDESITHKDYLVAKIPKYLFL